jgi:glutamate/tyrosine decarboxylase-like PLP-dependent enzyme
MQESGQHREEGFDPEDWEAFRALGRRMVDDVADWLRTLRERPVWQRVPDDVRARLATPLPQEGIGPEATYADFRRDVQPYPWGNVHPRFWGWVNGSGVPMGVLADLLASTMNSNVGMFEQSATYVEDQVLDWLKEMVGFPPETSAVLTSGGSMANIVGLGAARSAMASFDVRAEGLSAAPRRMVLYASSETHYSVAKAVDLLGLGAANLRTIAVDGDYRIDLAALELRIRDDRREGLEPIAVVGNAGTVNTGAVDDLEGLADLCAREKLWLHVDGAIAAVAWAAPELRTALAGLQRADSLGLDLHKWLYLPNDVGCVFVRDGKRHREAFDVSKGAAYVSDVRGGLASNPRRFADLGIELTRRFRALKAWMALKEHGARKFGRVIWQNVLQARHLAELVDGAPRLERLAPVPLNIVCFRYVAAGLEPSVLNELNKELLVRLQESGAAAPSHTVLEERFAIRCSITNHRSRRSDFDFLAAEVVRLGDELRTEYDELQGAPGWMPRSLATSEGGAA